jgi:hypothetical protein
MTIFFSGITLTVVLVIWLVLRKSACVCVCRPPRSLFSETFISGYWMHFLLPHRQFSVGDNTEAGTSTNSRLLLLGTYRHDCIKGDVESRSKQDSSFSRET